MYHTTGLTKGVHSGDPGELRFRVPGSAFSSCWFG
jgi:hypothetical protein